MPKARVTKLVLILYYSQKTGYNTRYDTWLFSVTENRSYPPEINRFRSHTVIIFTWCMGKKIKEEEKIFSDFFVNFQQSTNKVVVLAQAAQQSGNRTEEKAPNKRSTAADHTANLKLNLVASQFIVIWLQKGLQLIIMSQWPVGCHDISITIHLSNS